MPDDVTARTAEISNVERLTIGLIAVCTEAGATAEEIFMGVAIACVSTAAVDEQPARIESLRSYLDIIERRLIETAGVKWTH